MQQRPALFFLAAAAALLASSKASIAEANLLLDPLNNNNNPLRARQTTNPEETYLNSVCLPNVTNPIPPCQEIINIQEICSPNGTSPLDLLAHAECMCGGSFFSDWVGCLDCEYVHGGRSGAVFTAFNSIITSASNILCTGTPTADFTQIFNSLSDGFAATGSATGTTDLYPSQTAISLYFTATGPQGPGTITGSALLATAASTGSSTATTVATTGTAAQKTVTTATGSTASSSTSKAGAVQTGVMKRMLGVVAGGMAMAVAM